MDLSHRAHMCERFAATGNKNTPETPLTDLAACTVHMHLHR